MKLAELVEPFKELDVFSKLTDEQVMMIIESSERVGFNPGQVIIEDGREGDAAYFIVVGVVERLAQPELGRSREHFGHGILVGEMAMLVEHVHASTVRAKSEVKSLRISREHLYRILASNPAIADCFIETIRSRLNLMVDRIKEIDKTLEEAEKGAFEPMELVPS